MHVDNTKVAICNGQNNMQNYRLLKFRSMTGAVSWVFDDALDDHVWVSELTMSCREAKVLEPLQYNIANPCIVQSGMLWFSTPTSLNNGLFSNGVVLEKYNKVVNLAIVAAFTLHFG